MMVKDEITSNLVTFGHHLEITPVERVFGRGDLHIHYFEQRGFSLFTQALRHIVGYYPEVPISVICTIRDLNCRIACLT